MTIDRFCPIQSDVKPNNNPTILLSAVSMTNTVSHYQKKTFTHYHLICVRQFCNCWKENSTV